MVAPCPRVTLCVRFKQPQVLKNLYYLCGLNWLVGLFYLLSTLTLRLKKSPKDENVAVRMQMDCKKS